MCETDMKERVPLTTSVGVCAALQEPLCSCRWSCGSLWNLTLVRKMRLSRRVLFMATLAGLLLYFSPNLHTLWGGRRQLGRPVDVGLASEHDVTSNSAHMSSIAAALPQLTELHIPYRIKSEMLTLLPSNTCTCESSAPLLPVPGLDRLLPHKQVQQLEAAFEVPLLKDTSRRRQREYLTFALRHALPVKKMLVAEPNSPLSYPTQGLQVAPLQTILIPGLGLHNGDKEMKKVTLSAKLGVLDTMAEVGEVMAEGLGESRLSLSSSHLENLNLQLRTVTYTNTVYQPGTSEMVQLESGKHRAEIPIVVAHQSLPWLFDPGPDGNISNLVTVVTKTFLRYDKLKGLIASIRRFYPDITIIVADDSEHVEMLREPGVEQYIMPYGKGWFAGRNLAISQVSTKYLLWVDDDFLFSENTKLERMVEVLEKTSLDVVGGAVREVTGFQTTFQHKLEVQAGEPDGYCLHQHRGYYHPLAGLPNCVLTDGVVNFFMAHTRNVRRVGFDPQLNRVAHTEFFIDGLGELRVGSCSDISVNHASKIKLPWTQGDSDRKYNEFRYASGADGALKRMLRSLYFKNRLKCYSKD
ncbi:beta-1,4 N-acetylgalactosaminyltransferase 1-like isoform X1 [Lampetra fluviatilis]